MIGDICWDKYTNIPSKIDNYNNCGYPIWSTEGWKDGLSSINPTNITPLYSYDIFDMLITHLGMYMYVYICMCICMCIYVYLYTCICIYIYIEMDYQVLIPPI
jgi:hypothetical protein